MQSIRPAVKLVSLFVVFLTENFETRICPCGECGTQIPVYGKSFLINGTWVCVNCAISRLLNPWQIDAT